MFFISTLIRIIAIITIPKKVEHFSKLLLINYQKFKDDKYFHPNVELQCALIAAEDHRFFNHNGFDIIAIFRVIWKRLALNIIEGGSTIEQQLVRTLTLQFQRSLRRKLNEILLASTITKFIPKEDIPGLYIYLAYYGWRMNGFKQACKRLNFIPDKIMLINSADLIARLKYPEPQNCPTKRKQQIKNRTKYILVRYQKMYEDELYKPLLEKKNYESI